MGSRRAVSSPNGSLKTHLIKINNMAKEKEIKSDEIVVRDPQELVPVERPLVVTLPEGASKAQVEFAKVLNQYAYQNPQKWNAKKDKLIAQLKALKNAPDPVEDSIKFGKKNILA